MADPLASSSTPPASFSTTSYGRAKRVVASDVLGSHHPLLESSNSTFNPNSSSNAPYPVYTSRKPSLPVSPHASAPPLVTKAEDASSTAASSNGRSYSRSISEASPASEKLRGQNLRADIESLGLNSTGENESLGAAMVQKLSTVVGNVEFEGVLSAVGCDKVTLLLPVEKAGNIILSRELFLDHLVILDDIPSVPSTSKSTIQDLPVVRSFVTLSGLKGTIDSDKITIASPGIGMIDSTAGLLKTAAMISNPNFNNTTLHQAIRGASIPTISISNSANRFPQIALVGQVTEISVPRPSTIPLSAVLAPVISRTGSRLAALFTKPVSSELLPAEPIITTSRSANPNLLIQVLCIEKIITRKEVLKGISNSIDDLMRRELAGLEGLEGEISISDRLSTFLSKFQPPSNWNSCFPPSITDKRSTQNSREENYYTKDIEMISDGIQELFITLRNDLSRNIRSGINRERRRRIERGERLETEEIDSGLIEDKVDAGLNKIESVLTHLLYDRLFSPTTSGDASIDEELASRITALNMELSLEHLGLDLSNSGWDGEGRTIRDSLEEIISSAGIELQKLTNSRTSADKLTIFVNLHKIIVEGLSSLPPISTKEISEKPINKSLEVEMATTSRPMSITSIEETDESILATPKPELVQTFAAIPDMSLPEPSLVEDALSSSVYDPPPVKKSNPSSADLILPLLIFLVVQYNPPHLVSHLLFVQRFRAESLLTGMDSYSATTIQGVIEFLQNVDVGALGLSNNANKLIGTESVGNRSRSGSGTKLRGRVTNVSQELDRFVDSANSSLVSAVDSSYRMISSLGLKGIGPRTIDEARGLLDGAKARSGAVLRRRAASSPSDARPIDNLEVKKEMIDFVDGVPIAPSPRPSIGDRLASISGLSRSSSPVINRTDLPSASDLGSPLSYTQELAIAPVDSSCPPPLPPRKAISLSASVSPIPRFLECEVEDLTMGEVALLLSDYKRLAAALALKPE